VHGLHGGAISSFLNPAVRLGEFGAILLLKTFNTATSIKLSAEHLILVHEVSEFLGKIGVLAS
jgi:hypothetical protein